MGRGGKETSQRFAAMKNMMNETSSGFFFFFFFPTPSHSMIFAGF